jgi:hypothetical protein
MNNLLGYYPTYSILDEVVSSTQPKNLNIYIDLKNNLQLLYMEPVIKQLISDSLMLGTGKVDTSVFQSVISFLIFHKEYARKRNNLKINFFIFMESGSSFYHLNIDKRYKANRRIDDLYGLDREKRDYFYFILQRNYMLLESFCNKLPNVKMVRMDHLEADFIPFYLIRNKMVDISDETTHMIYSNDHDLLQCLELEGNIYVFNKGPNYKKIIKKGEVINSYLKFGSPYPDNLLTLCMAIMGDIGDNVFGVKGIGNKRLEVILPYLIKMIGSVSEMRDNVYNGRNIFNSTSCTIQNKYLNEVLLNESDVIRNLKLVDFEIISKFVSSPDTTEMLTRKKHIDSVISEKKVFDCDILKKAIEMTGVYLEEDLSLLYI